MYSNESERANKDIYDDFKLLKKTFGLNELCKKYFSALRVTVYFTGLKVLQLSLKKSK